MGPLLLFDVCNVMLCGNKMIDLIYQRYSNKIIIKWCSKIKN
jgi:hypothetical protein